MHKKFINYIRVSKQKQSDVGWEAQRRAVVSFVEGNAIVKESVEIESGKQNNLLYLLVAIEYAKKQNPRLWLLNSIAL